MSKACGGPASQASASASMTVARPGASRRRGFAQARHVPAFPFDEGRVGGAPRERFEPQRAAAGEKVEAAAAGHLGHQPVEQGLPDSVRRRPDAALARKADAPSAPLAADDAQGLVHFLQRTSLKLAR